MISKFEFDEIVYSEGTAEDAKRIVSELNHHGKISKQSGVWVHGLRRASGLTLCSLIFFYVLPSQGTRTEVMEAAPTK